MPYKGLQHTADADGLYTGENLPLYDPVVEARMVVGVPTGRASLQEFGIEEGYFVTAVTDDVNCKLSVNDIVWLNMGKLQPYDETTFVYGTPFIDDGEIKVIEEGTAEARVVGYNHIVTRVAKSFGYITYTLKEVDYDYYADLPEPIVSA